MLKSKQTKWLPLAVPVLLIQPFMIRVSPQTAVNLRHTAETMLDMQTTCLSGRLHVMSHTLPQPIQTAAVAEVQILMTDDMVPHQHDIILSSF